MKRLVYIDSLRGIASLIVAIFWHYQHFSITYQPNSIGILPPLYKFSIIRFFYDSGDSMVDLFFVLSGVIFTYNYRDAIKNSSIDAYTFFIKRFSRLYPVHLFTLLFITILVNIYFYLFKRFPIYCTNDVYHFVLNVFFIQKGFFDEGYSFNAPAWSLSVEIFLYILFFIQSSFKYTMYSSVIFLLVGLIIYKFAFDFTFILNPSISRGLIGFFSGSLLYEVFIKNEIYKKYRVLLLVLCAILIFTYYSYFKVYINLPTHLLMVFVTNLLVVECYYNPITRYFLENKIFKFLGDISLSVYLIHVPVQVLFLLYFNIKKLQIHYDTELLLLSYAICVVSAGWITHTLVEKPSQKWIRSKLKKPLFGSTAKNMFYQ